MEEEGELLKTQQKYVKELLFPRHSSKKKSEKKKSEKKEKTQKSKWADAFGEFK